MNLQWYPGHMTKARRAMEENLKLVDLIVELRDARIPAASANPDLAELGKGKKRILLLSKADLADSRITEAWETCFREEGILPLALDAREKKKMAEVRRLLDTAAQEKRTRDLARGIKNSPVRVMVAGIPNVGKSTFINSLVGQARTRTGDKPGVTKGLQWIRLSGGLELLDTPGILWPKFEDEQTGIHLALMGTINEDVLPLEELAARGIERCEELYPDALLDTYGFRADSPHAFLETLAARQGLLQKGGEPDPEKAARRFLDDLKRGKLGRISLDRPQNNA